MLRKGFTLIELLIVITIIAILAGAAIPYVQDYVEESRTARAKQDIDEIKGALMRWEMERGRYPSAVKDINPLVGPYLSKSLADPWGGQYHVNEASSTIQSYGPDRLPGGGDDVIDAFRPPLAVTKAYYLDVNDNGLIDDGDTIKIKCTRPIDPTSIPNAAQLKWGDTTTLTAGAEAIAFDGFGASMSFGITTAFKVGVSSFTVDPSILKDMNGVGVKTTSSATIRLP